MATEKGLVHMLILVRFLVKKKIGDLHSYTLHKQKIFNIYYLCEEMKKLNDSISMPRKPV